MCSCKVTWIVRGGVEQGELWSSPRSYMTLIWSFRSGECFAMFTAARPLMDAWGKRKSNRMDKCLTTRLLLLAHCQVIPTDQVELHGPMMMRTWRSMSIWITRTVNYIPVFHACCVSNMACAAGVIGGKESVEGLVCVPPAAMVLDGPDQNDFLDTPCRLPVPLVATTAWCWLRRWLDVSICVKPSNEAWVLLWDACALAIAQERHVIGAIDKSTRTKRWEQKSKNKNKKDRRQQQN
jgi:hypothetical protein